MKNASGLACACACCKDPDASRRKWENHCQSFLSSVHLVIRHPKDVIIQCLIALGQLMSLMLVIIAIYQAFGLSGISVGELLAMGVLLYMGASYTPLPGASGAQEGRLCGAVPRDLSGCAAVCGTADLAVFLLII